MSKPSTLVNSPSAEFHESPHDIEMQSPARGTFHEDEKLPIGLFPSTPSDRTEVDRFPSEEPQRPRPVRKYSGEWWRRYWNRAIIVGHLPRILYGTLGLVIVALWIGLSFYFAQNEIDWNKSQQIKFAEHMRDSKTESAIALEGALKNFDPIARSLNVEWSGLWKDHGVEMDPVPLTNGTAPNTAWPFEVYRDTATTLWVSGPGNSYANDGDLLYKIANASTPAIAVIGWTVDDSFNTDISFKQASEGNDIFRQPLFAYPYDEWKGSISFTINDPWQDQFMGVNKSSVFAPSGARLSDHALNWRFDLTVTKDCPEEITESIFTTNYGVTLDSGYDNETLAFGTVPCQLRVEMTARRPPMVKFAAILSLLVNWTSTFFIFILTCEVLIMRRGFMLAGTDLFGVTFTSLFALPSVRLLLPGAPDFGALNLVGIIPNVIIISICIIAIAVTKLNKNKYQEKEA
ncbi:hypothetical protein CPB86DRAFT_819303 [Serendipita vermifera]|nr:hypothetical protein CPB86DRAFT_819303 [Serendipita vermifera]